MGRALTHGSSPKSRLPTPSAGRPGLNATRRFHAHATDGSLCSIFEVATLVCRYVEEGRDKAEALRELLIHYGFDGA